MADKKEKLFSDFSPVSTEQWMEKVTADLKGADFEKKLVWKTNEGFKVKPFYRMEDLEGLKTTDALPGEFPYLRGTKKDNNAWLVRQEIRVECPKEANAKALDILNKGVDSLSFHVKAKELNAEYIETLLSDIQAECVELNFSTCQGHVVELANLLVAYFQKKDYDVKKLKGSINYDFFNKMLTRGKEKGDMVQTAKSLIEAIQPLPFYRVLNVNALSLNNAGAYISEIFRGSIESVNKGQMEAGRSLGLNKFQTMRYIIIPQAFKSILPPLGNEFIAMLKDSSLVSVIGFEELTRRGQLIIARTYASFEIWMAVAIIYLIMTFAVARFTGYLERRFDTK